jgi:hypothetical protein
MDREKDEPKRLASSLPLNTKEEKDKIDLLSPNFIAVLRTMKYIPSPFTAPPSSILSGLFEQVAIQLADQKELRKHHHLTLPSI